MSAEQVGGAVLVASVAVSLAVGLASVYGWCFGGRERPVQVADEEDHRAMNAERRAA